MRELLIFFVQMDQLGKAASGIGFRLCLFPFLGRFSFLVGAVHILGSGCSDLQREDPVLIFNQAFLLFMQPGNFFQQFIFLDLSAAENEIAADQLYDPVDEEKDEYDFNNGNKDQKDPGPNVKAADNVVTQLFEIADDIQNKKLPERQRNGLDESPDVLPQLPKELYIVFCKFRHG